MLAMSLQLWGQSERARIIGTVTDPQGAVIPGGNVTVINVATGVPTKTVTDQMGQYQAPELPIGAYKVKVEHSGFKTTETGSYTVEINQVLRVDVRLAVGATNEVVTVEGAATVVDTVNPTMGSTVSEMEIHNAPLNGRNALDLALLQPGVLPADNPGNTGTASAGTAFSISGGRNDSNTFLLDGGVNNNLLDNGVVYNPNPDAVQEFRVLTNNFSAEYGRNAGGIISEVLKSGTNEFHGTAFEYNRNEDYNANNYILNSLGAPRQILKRNQYGGTIGGPIVKNKLFFFLAYQGQRQTQTAASNVADVMTPAELQGDFSASPNQASVAAFLQANPFFALNAAAGIIDPKKIDPVAQAYIKAGLVPISTTGSLAFANPATDNREEITGKFDWELTANDHISAALGRNSNPFSAAGLNPAPSQFIDSGNNHHQFLNLTYVRTISANMLNELRVSVQRRNRQQAVPQGNLGTPQSFGSNITPDNPVGPALLTFPNLNIGFSPQGPTSLTDNTFVYSDTFSWTHARHNWKFGASFSAYQDNQLFDFFVNGNFDFVPSIGNGPFGAGDAFANFLLGIPDFYFQAPAAPSNIRTKATYFFGQDEWHLASNLVLTLGLRYEYSTPKSDTLGRTFSVVPGAQSTVFPNAPVGVLFPGDKGAPTGSNFPQRSNFAPRLGFAWQPFHDGKTSVRGGFGLFYDILKAEDNFQFNGQFPFASTAFIGFNDPTGTAAPFGLVTDPFGSTGTPNPFPSKPINHNISFVDNVGTFGGGGVFFVDPNLRTPYTYQFNLSIEHEVARKMSVEAAYVGSSSHGLTGLKDINPCDLNTSTATNCNRVLNETPGNTLSSLGFMPQFMNVANANYNALQLSLRQQQASVPFLGNMYYTLGYTWAHSLDDGSGFRNNSSQVPFYLPHLFYGSSDFDVRQALTFSGGWDLPFHAGPKPLVKGWSLYPILSFRTGYPFTVTAGLNELNGTPSPSGAGDGNLVNANQVAPIQYVNSHATGMFFNPAAFDVNPPTSGYGTAPRNAYTGPGRTNFDMSLAKVTPIYRERVTLKLSVDAFNLFNHTQFRSVGANIAAPNNLGQVLSVYDPRILQLSAHIGF
jgi:outer membrane receptor protein involved in Fe transport